MELTITVDDVGAGTRLDTFVAGKAEELSRSRVQKLIESGDIQVNGRQQNARYVVRDGDTVSVVVPAPLAAGPQPENIPLEVVFEDEHLLVINKSAGLVVHPGAGQPDGTLVNALLGRPGSVSSIGGVERPGIVHRLDKDTSGLMVVAKTDQSHVKLTEALAERKVRRVYYAIACRRFPVLSGKVDASIGRHQTQRIKMSVRSGSDSRDAVTHWRVLEQYHSFALVECRLQTGRTHQIRVHLAHIKHPVAGDTLYGGGVDLLQQIASQRTVALRNQLKVVQRQMLHARELKFTHPITGEELAFLVEPPADFQLVLNALRVDAKLP